MTIMHGNRTPRYPEIGVIALVPDKWGTFWSVRHHILSHLARDFYVLWMSPAHDRQDTFQRLRSGRSLVPIPEVAPGLMIYTPEFWLPNLHRPAGVAATLSRARLRRARQALLRRGCTRIVLYLWRPEFSPALRHVCSDLSCYHIDDEYSFSSVPVPDSEAELSLIAEVDQVFIHSRGLLERKGCINPNTAFVPLGVDYSVFAAPQVEPADLVTIPRPRIGYTGHLKRQMNWELLIKLAEMRLEWSFVYVGDFEPHPEILEHVERLKSLPNVHFLGPKVSSDIPAYVQHFDVCTLPYVLDWYTDMIYPLKLHEYFAAGRPVVGTPIRSLEEFSDMVPLARDAGGWARAISELLESDSPSHRDQRKLIARQHDWQVLVGRVTDSILHHTSLE
jgi:glycosyltransferase involved in cell wall biosynthesis